MVQENKKGASSKIFKKKRREERMIKMIRNKVQIVEHEKERKVGKVGAICIREGGRSVEVCWRRAKEMEERRY